MAKFRCFVSIYYVRGLSSTTGFRHAINFSSDEIGYAHFCSVSLTLMGFISSLLDVGAWLWVREYVALANAIRIRRYLERTKVKMNKSTAFVQYIPGQKEPNATHHSDYGHDQDDYSGSTATPKTSAATRMYVVINESRGTFSELLYTTTLTGGFIPFFQGTSILILVVTGCFGARVIAFTLTFVRVKILKIKGERLRECSYQLCGK